MTLDGRSGDFTKVELYEGCAYITQRERDVYRMSMGFDGLPVIELLTGSGRAELAGLRARYAPKDAKLSG